MKITVRSRKHSVSSARACYPERKIYSAREEDSYDGEMNEDAGMLQHEQKY